jgi:TonB family protein
LRALAIGVARFLAWAAPNVYSGLKDRSEPMTRSILVAGVLTAVTGVAGAQPLGSVAEKEKARRDSVKAPARVITGQDLKEAPPATAEPTLPPGDAAADPAQARIHVAAAKFARGAAPQIPVTAVAGGEVVLEVAVGRDGRVTGTKTLRATPPFTDALIVAVRGWQFKPAEDMAAPVAGQPADPATRRPMESTVLAIGLFRPPAIFSVTQGEPPKTVADASPGAPALQGALTMPIYPPQALNDGVVLMELELKADGSVERISVVQSAPPFDQPALDAVRGLRFRPARVHGRPAPSTVYVAAAFRQPIT